MWLVYAWVNPTDLDANKTLIVYAFHDIDKMIKNLSKFKAICEEKNIQFKYNIIEQEENE